MDGAAAPSKANGRDVGGILISKNLAVPFVCGQTRCPPTPKPWCACFAPESERRSDWAATVLTTISMGVWIIPFTCA